MSLKTLIKVSLFIIMVFTLSGCTVHTKLKSTSVVDYSKKYKIDVLMDFTNKRSFFGGEITNIVTLYINDTIALKGNAGADYSCDMQGIFDEKELTLECAKNSIFSPISCLVHLDKKRLEEVSLSYAQ